MVPIGCLEKHPLNRREITPSPPVCKRPKTTKGRNGHGAHETGSGRARNGLQAYSSRNRSHRKRKRHRGRRGLLYGPMRTQSGGGSRPLTIVAARSRPPHLARPIRCSKVTRGLLPRVRHDLPSPVDHRQGISPDCRRGAPENEKTRGDHSGHRGFDRFCEVPFQARTG